MLVELDKHHDSNTNKDTNNNIAEMAIINVYGYTY